IIGQFKKVSKIERKGKDLSTIYSLDSDFSDKNELGNKGANLVTMTHLGLPVPPGFVVSISAFKTWLQSEVLPEEDIKKAMVVLESRIGRGLGKGLEVSVRSSAPVSMPGMMDTILNIGDLEGIMTSVKRIFESWNTPRAIEYRRLNNISPSLGTSAIVQIMVYGNKDTNSATGVLFSRNPSTGIKELFGEYLMQEQGEAIVSGAKTPEPISKLRSMMSEAYSELLVIANKLEQHFCDMQDMEFTIESGKVYMLQTRSGKRSGNAAVKIAVDMINEGLITREEAILRITVDDIRQILHKRIRNPENYKPLVKGLNAAPGAASGKVVFNTLQAVSEAQKGVPVILVRIETSPDDIHGIAVAQGVLTQKGGLTSHAAVVTRGMGKPCICGAEGIGIDPLFSYFEVQGQKVKAGEEITIDGTSGNVYIGSLPLEDAKLTLEFEELMKITDGFKRLGVRANADTPVMIRKSKEFRAEGIGLCRTERMFNMPERLKSIREFILAETEESREVAIEHLGELQIADFVALFDALQGIPIIIRLLDLPLHEFLPSEDDVTDPMVKKRIRELKETNPMLGHRGVRLALTTPEIYRMQIAAIQKAIAIAPAKVSIMVPQVITLQEALNVKNMLKDSNLKFGVMMETVRACMRAGRLAMEVDFFSFGTNDLTQAVYSFSREDAEKKFLPTYLAKGVLRDNPFEVLDVKGVGRLMETAIFWARRSNKTLEIGVCGEQAGEPRSIRYLHGIGIDYLSCSPFRIPIAKLVSAQAAIQERMDKAFAESYDSRGVNS
ncbi:MAG: pyruvate, phosphate dikinase, partial [Methanoregulaceae archaeon]|nr:pyruvate, phosphate dikinase [Methanoregulaceae archaeon]